MGKSLINTTYFNPILKVWEREEVTPYLKKDFVSWDYYATIIERAKLQK